MDGAIDPQRHGVAQLLNRLGRSEREHDRLTTPGFDDPHRLLDAAFLVRADREAEMSGLERPGIGRKHHLSAREGHPFDTDEDLHERMRAFSGSNRGREPATATVTG